MRKKRLGGALLIQCNADLEEAVDGIARADEGGGFVIAVEIQQVEERLQHFLSADLETVVELIPAGLVEEVIGELVVVNAAGELDAGERHGEGGLLERGEGAVQVEADVVGGLGYRCLTELILVAEFEDKALGMAIAKVEAGGFEHEALEADDGLGMLFEHLHERSKPLRSMMIDRRVRVPDRR